MKKTNSHLLKMAPALAGCLILSATCAKAGYITTTLGAAGPSNYAIFALSTVTDFHFTGPGTTTGNVADNGNNVLALDGSAGPSINGNLYLGPNASNTHSSLVTGTIFTNQNLSAANAAALNAATTFKNLAATTGPTVISGTTTINGVAGINVINLTGLNLGLDEVLTLNGPAGAQFVINDSGGFVLNGGKIYESGGVTSTDVVINLTSNADARTSHGLNDESTINGILLAPLSNIAFAPGLINGELIAGGPSIQLVSGSSVVAPPPPPGVPEPSTWLYLVTGIGVISFFSTRKSSAKQPA